MNRSLYDLLAEELPRRLPLHMPGHKRSSLLAPYLKALRADLDVTEIEGFDNLHEPRGILLDGMRRAASLWGACRSFYLVNGSTGGILAGLRALSRA
ncbi:MAG: ornithine decarboxylase, partial [Clostridiales bacterium]|nr:ornithine decarboxylase [Clostridiales bacterium]